MTTTGWRFRTRWRINRWYERTTDVGLDWTVRGYRPLDHDWFFILTERIYRARVLCLVLGHKRWERDRFLFCGKDMPR